MRTLKWVVVPAAVLFGVTLGTLALLEMAPASTASVAKAQDADPDCANLGTPVYLAGASAVRPIVREAQRALARAGSDVIIIYQGTASCDGPSAIVNDLNTTGTADYWDFSEDTEANVPRSRCNLPLGGVKPDIGISDVMAATCEAHLGGNFAVTGNLREYSGPVQAMVLAAQQASTEDAISAAAARIVLGFGGETHTIAPWTVNDELHNRVPESGTKILMAAAIGLLSPKWKGTLHPSNPDVLSAIVGATNPNAAIGLLAADFADQNRDQLKVLALQADGQSCGYLPDSSRTATDKVNVREGRYAASAPVQYTVEVDPSSGLARARDGRTNHEDVQQVLQFLRMDDLDDETMHLMIEATAAANTVPMCAMKVQWSREGAMPTPYAPTEPCHCLYEELNGRAPGVAACDTCATDDDCTDASAPVCRFGFCEER
jgi:ABC-type phosphate transport system substrate-binding protein